MKWFMRIALGLVVVLIAVFLNFRTPDTDAEAMRAKYGGEPSQFIEIGDGQTVHLRDEGPRDAPAIILLHGSNADLHTWEAWAQDLSKDYRVIRFDQVGHGLTGPDTSDDYSLQNYVADIDEVADALALDRFVLAGSSMGGGHTIGYALEHPQRVLGLVLVDASGAPVEREGGGGNIGFTIAQTPVLNQLMKHITPRSLVEQSLSESLSNQEVVTEAAIDRYWELLRYPGNRAATIQRFNTPRVTYSNEDVATLEMHALILWGEEDRLTPVEAGRWYDQSLPSSKMIEYPKIGHLPHEEAPEASLADLRKWLEALPDFESAQPEGSEE